MKMADLDNIKKKNLLFFISIRNRTTNSKSFIIDEKILLSNQKENFFINYERYHIFRLWCHDSITTLVHNLWIKENKYKINIKIAILIFNI